MMIYAYKTDVNDIIHPVGMDKKYYTVKEVKCDRVVTESADGEEKIFTPTELVTYVGGTR